MPLCICLYCAFHAMTLTTHCPRCLRRPNPQGMHCVHPAADTGRPLPRQHAVGEAPSLKIIGQQQMSHSSGPYMATSMYTTACCHGTWPLFEAFARQLKGLRRTHHSLCSPDTKHGGEMQQSNQHSTQQSLHTLLMQSMAPPEVPPTTVHQALHMPPKPDLDSLPKLRTRDQLLAKQPTYGMQACLCYTTPAQGGIPHPHPTSISPRTPTDCVNRIQYIHLARHPSGPHR